VTVGLTQCKKNCQGQLQTPHSVSLLSQPHRVRGQLKCDGTRAETRFTFSAKRTSPFKSAGGRQVSRLLAAEVCASAVVMLDIPCSEVVRRVLAIHCIRQFPLHFPSCTSPCAVTFQLESASQKVVVFSCDNLKSCALYRFDTVHVAGRLRTAFHSDTAPCRQQLLISQKTTVILTEDIAKPAVRAHASFDVRYFASCGPVAQSV